MLDLARLVCGLCPYVFVAPGARRAFLEALFTACDWSGSWAKAEVSHARATNVLLTFRAISNAYQPGGSLEDVQWVLEVRRSGCLCGGDWGVDGGTGA